MGLFDKIKKKDNEVSQKNENEVVTQVAEGVGTEAPVEGSQTIMTEVSVDNNPFVEEITPVEESQVAPQPEGPSFDNIFNATPGDLIMPESAPVVEVQPQQDLQIENVNNEVGQSKLVNVIRDYAARNVSVEAAMKNVVEYIKVG